MKKTKLSKRILSVLLALMMVVTSVPMVAITALADTGVNAGEDQYVTAARSAMQNLNDFLAEPGTFTNVTQAYNAYVNCQAAIDAYKYGNSGYQSLQRATDDLNTAITQIGTGFTPFTATDYGSFSADANYIIDNDTGHDYRMDVYKNVLYAEKNMTTVAVGGTGASVKASVNDNDRGISFEAYYPTTTFLYDGINPMSTSVAVQVSAGSAPSASSGKVRGDRYVYGVGITDNYAAATNGSPVIKLATDWIGPNWTDGTFDVQWILNTTDTNVGYRLAASPNSETNYNLKINTHDSGFLGLNHTNKTQKWVVANKITLADGVTFAASNDYSRIISSLKFTDYSGSTTNTSYSDIVAESTATAPIVIVNYKAVLDALAAGGTKMKSVQLSKFSEGTLLGYFEAMDAATQWNPNDYFNSGVKTNGNANNYSACLQDMSAIIQAVERADTSTENYPEFKRLRDAMDAKMTDYNNGVNTVFDTDSFAQFKTIYENAMSIMNQVAQSNMTYEDLFLDADLAAEELENFQLTMPKDPLNVSEITGLIDAFNDYELMFTSDTYNNAVAVIENAKKTIWPDGNGGYEYKSLIYQIPDDDEGNNQTTLDTQTALVRQAIKDLRIDPDAVILTSAGRYSLNSACDLINQLERPETDYSDIDELKNLIRLVTEPETGYRAQLADTPLTDYAAQYALHCQKIVEIVEKYENLHLTFLLLEDGQMAKTATTYSCDDTATVSVNNNKRNVKLGFKALDQTGVMFKKTHDAAVLPFGDAYVTFGCDESDSSRWNFIDSFTLNATQDSNAAIGSVNFSDTPGGLNDTQKNDTYKSVLEYNNVKLTNFQVFDISKENIRGYYAKFGGANCDKRTYEDDRYTQLLANTDGVESEAPDGIYVNSNSTGSFATITLKADANVVVEATTPRVADLSATLTRDEILAAYDFSESNNEIVTFRQYTASGNYGGVCGWNTTRTVGLIYAGYCFVKGNATYETGCKVVDVADYFDFVTFCQRFSEQGGQMWETTSWEAFTNQLSLAKTYTYANKEATVIKTNLNAKYDALYTALQNLTERTYNVNFVTKTSELNATTGEYELSEVTNTVTVKYGQPLSTYTSQVQDIINNIAVYEYDYSSWRFANAWTLTPDSSETSAVNYSSPVYSDITYYAVYTATPLFANFDLTDNDNQYNYNAAKNAFAGLEDNLYTVASLQALAETLNGVPYFTYSDEEQAATSKSEQNSVNSAAAQLRSIYSTFISSSAELSGDALTVAEAAARSQILAAADVDRYDLVPDFNFVEPVQVGDTIIYGVVFSTQDEVNAAVADFLNNLNSHIQTYNIYLNGSDTPINSAPIPYGTAVAVDSNGTVTLDADSSTEYGVGCSIVNWTYSYDAPSRNGAGATAPKYMRSTPALQFTVKGDTFLGTTPAEGSDGTYVVRVISSTGNIIDVQTTSGSYTMPAAPEYAFYTFAGYSNGAESGATISVTEDTIIRATYEPVQEDQYAISFAPSFDAVFPDAGDPDITTAYYPYNTKVTLEPEDPEDVFCWAILEFNDYYGDAEELTIRVISYETGDYSFYACESINMLDMDAFTGKVLVPLSYDYYEAYVIDCTDVEKVDGMTYVNGTYSYPDVEFVQKADLLEQIVDINGNPILGSAASYNRTKNKFTVTEIADPTPATTVIKNSNNGNSFAVVDNGSIATKFSLIGTFALPEGYTMVESGFLFTKNTDANASDLVLENSGTSGIMRMKSSKTTVGNQFVINYSTTRSIDFKYVSYTIFTDGTDVIVAYSSVVDGNNHFTPIVDAD